MIIWVETSVSDLRLMSLWFILLKTLTWICIGLGMDNYVGIISVGVIIFYLGDYTRLQYQLYLFRNKI